MKTYTDISTHHSRLPLAIFSLVIWLQLHYSMCFDSLLLLQQTLTSYVYIYYAYIIYYLLGIFYISFTFIVRLHSANP